MDTYPATKELLEAVSSMWSTLRLHDMHQQDNWATLFLGDINMGTWNSRLGESQMRQ
jgi:hypothetical protein